MGSSEWFKEWFELRNNLIYKVYGISFVLTNWKTFYVLLFSSNYSGSERIFEAQQEFILRTFFGIYWSDFGLQIIVPALVTILVIKYVPKINELAYSEYLKSDGTNRRAKRKRDLEIEREITDIKQDEAVILKERELAQTEINDLRNKIRHLESTNITDEDKWQKEYKLMDKQIIKNLTKQLNTIIYGNRGYYNDNISSDDLALSESLGLIEFNEDRRVIKYTKKGLYINSLN